MRALLQRLFRRTGSSVVESSPESRLVVSRRIFDLSPALTAELRRLRDSRGHDEITRSHDAFLLDPGLGPATYLTTDGRVLWDDDGWGVTGTRADALAAIRAGIDTTGLARLSDLLPRRPSDAVDCADCDGTGRFDAHGQMVDTKKRRVSIICMACAGLGWTAASVPLEESVLGAG